MIRKILIYVGLLVVFISARGECAAPQTVPIRSLAPGQVCVVKARIGQRVVAAESDGVYVFTLRDDYGDTILGRTTKDTSTIAFGATYYVTGDLVKNASTGNRKMFDVSDWRAVYQGYYVTHQVRPSPWLFAIPIVLVLIAAGGIVWFVQRKVASAAVPEAWGYADVQSGPDQGLMFALREDRVLVGKKQDPAKALSIVLDNYVSRNQGVIIREGSQIFFEDSGSKNGSWVDERKVESGQRAAIRTGSLIRIGPKTVIGIRLAGDQKDDPINQTKVFGESDQTFNWQEAVTHRGTESDDD